MLGFISLIFLNIHSIPINLNDSILSDTTAAVIDTIDSTSYMNDSFVIEEIKEAPIKIISFKVNSNQIYELSEENNFMKKVKVRIVPDYMIKEVMFKEDLPEQFL